VPSALARLRELPPELRNAGIAAAALALTLFLPWYEQSYVPEGSREFVQRNVSAFGVFTFVEAAVLLVAAGVLFLVWARSENKGFHLPGGDGTAIALAGGWAILLLVWRLFDKPDSADPSTDYGIQWGIFAALVAAAALLATGLRVRAAHRPEPPNPAAEEEDDWVAPARPPREPRPDRRPRDASAFTEALRERPAWEGEPGEPPSRARRSGEPTRPFGEGDAETRRYRDDEAATRRLPRDDEATRRLARDDEATRRLPRDDEATRRLPRDDEATRRYRDEQRRLPPEPTGRLWEDPEER
jgi:hypothetical protein